MVVNKQGASGIIGSKYVAESKPDGHTIFLTSGGPITINPAMYKKLPYDPIQDFAPVTTVAGSISSSLCILVPGENLWRIPHRSPLQAGVYTYASIGSAALTTCGRKCL